MKTLIMELIYRLRGYISTKRLIRNGLIIGKRFYRNDAMIDFGFCWLIKIGDDVTLGPGVIVLAHDATTYKYLGRTKIGTVTIGDRVFIGANSTILPNVKIGNDVVVGANSVICSNIPDKVVVAGVPAKIICTMDEYIENMKNRVDDRCFDEKIISVGGKISKENAEIVKKRLDSGIGFCE